MEIERAPANEDMIGEAVLADERVECGPVTLGTLHLELKTPVIWQQLRHHSCQVLIEGGLSCTCRSRGRQVVADYPSSRIAIPAPAIANNVFVSVPTCTDTRARV